MHTTADELEELMQRFQGISVNPSYALNFILGSFKTKINKGETLTAAELKTILESALRFSNVRQ